MTAVVLDDLETIFGEDGDSGPVDPCEGRDNCPKEPMFLAFFRPGCSCNNNPARLCLGCKDYVVRHAAGHGIICTKCSALWVLIRIEPLLR